MQDMHAIFLHYDEGGGEARQWCSRFASQWDDHTLIDHTLIAAKADDGAPVIGIYGETLIDFSVKRCDVALTKIGAGFGVGLAGLGLIFLFRETNDAVEFKLRWGGVNLPPPRWGGNVYKWR